MASPPLINLKSEDGIKLSVDPEVAKMSTVLRDMAAICDEAEEGVEEPPIPVNVTGDIMKMVLQWCERHYRKEGATSDKEARQLEKWGQVLHAITQAANYLDIKGLLDICLYALANQIKGKNSQEIREFFGLSAAGARGAEEDLFCLDSVHLRQIVPEKVWILVTNKLLQTSPGDLENLSNSSPYFQNLLLAKRTAFLFERVFSLVAPSVWKAEGLQGLPVVEVLQLRTVCSNWSTAVDKLIPEKFQHFGEETSSSVAFRIRYTFKHIMRNRLRHNDHQRLIGLPISKFLRHFESTHPSNQPKGLNPNPLIWGTLELETHEHYRNDNEYKRHLNNISKLFFKYGSHFHKLDINLGAENINLLPNKLRAWLARVPNLKQLAVTCAGGDFLRRYWLENHKWKFPKLKHLEKLDLYSLPAPMFNQLIRQTSQVSSLTILNPNDDNYKFFTFPLPNLKNLRMLWFKGNYIEKLRSSQVQWPLESLRFTLRSVSEEDDDHVGIAALFQVIQEKFAKTLVNLDLVVDDLGVGENCIKTRLDLPKLKKFRLTCWFIEKEVGLDFLLPTVNNLEEINLQFERKRCGVEDKDIANGPPTVQFIGFEENLLNSNIWTIFRKLKIIELLICGGNSRGCVRKSYCREDWLQKKRDA